MVWSGATCCRGMILRLIRGRVRSREIIWVLQRIIIVWHKLLVDGAWVVGWGAFATIDRLVNRWWLDRVRKSVHSVHHRFGVRVCASHCNEVWERWVYTIGMLIIGRSRLLQLVSVVLEPDFDLNVRFSNGPWKDIYGICARKVKREIKLFDQKLSTEGFMIPSHDYFRTYCARVWLYTHQNAIFARWKVPSFSCE